MQSYIIILLKSKLPGQKTELVGRKERGAGKEQLCLFTVLWQYFKHVAATGGYYREECFFSLVIFCCSCHPSACAGAFSECYKW